MFHPPPEDPFLDSSGFALEAIFEDEDGHRLGSGYIASLSPRAMMSTIELDDGSFAGVVQFQRRESEPFLWTPILKWDDAGQWETVPHEQQRTYRIVVGMLVGQGMLEREDDDQEREDDE